MGFELTGATPDERLKELTEKLEQGVSEIFTSGRYAEYLSAMSKFHTYSFGNVMRFSCKTRLHPVWPGFTHGRRILSARSRLVSMG